MKNILALSIFGLSLLMFSCKEDASKKIRRDNLEIAKERDTEIKLDGPKISFNKTEHDFGTINEGDIVETVFEFTNSGKSELIISSAKGSCGCTVPQWPKEPIAPGEKGEIKVKFNSYKKPNKQQKQVTLLTNTVDGKEILIIKAQVTPSSSKVKSTS